MRRPGPLWYSVGVTVQPGCTNLRLGTLPHSRTNADDGSRIGCGQARAKTEDKWKMESVAHTLILGEHKANIKSRDLPALMDVREEPAEGSSLAGLTGAGQHYHWMGPWGPC
jgi:hypothetical protein